MAVRQKQSLSLQVQNELQQMLMDGTFNVGEYLPSEGALAERFGVSRTTMRDAVGALVEKGFLERRHGKGVLAIDKSEDVVADSLRILMMRGNYSVAEFMETRKVVEGQIAYLAADRATEEQIAAMQKSIDKMVAKSEKAKEYAQHDILFHLQLAEASQNRLLKAVLVAVQPLLNQMVEHVVWTGGQVEEDCKFHTEILEAIRQRDAKLAQKKMYNHLNASESMFKESIDSFQSVSDITARLEE